MRMLENFKVPGEMSDSDDLDELVEDVDEFGMPVVIAADHISDDEEDADLEPPGDADYVVGDDDDYESEENDSDSSDLSMSNFPEGMEESDSDASQEENASKAGKAQNEDKPSGSGLPPVSGDDEGGGGGVHDLDANAEDDHTVRAIINAIKKKRSAPPEIKLEAFVTDICFHPERDIIALATIEGDVCLYEYSIEGNKLLDTVEVHAKSCRDVEFSGDGLNMLTCSKDKCIMVTDVATTKLKKFYESAHDEAINKLYVIDENLFCTGDDGGTVKLWDLRTKDPIFALKEVEDYITQMLTNDAKKLLLVTSGDGYLTTLNLGARKLYVQSEPYEEELNCMGLYRGDSKLVVGTSKGRLYSYNWGQFGYHCDMFPGLKTPISGMLPVTDRIACVAGEEGIIRACHIAPFRNLGIVGQHNMPIECLDISSYGDLIASSSHNNDVRFWSIKYFEEFGDIKYNEKHNPTKEKSHNLPSSKHTNASDFFSDLAKPPSDDDGDEAN